MPAAPQQQFLERLPVRSSNNSKAQSSSITTSAAAAEQQVLTNDPAAEALLALLDYSLAHPQQQQLGGPGGHPVLRLLLSRLQDGSGPRSRGDNFKLGLVVEGGGMRGIVTGAMLMGLQDMGMLNVFDAVYGEATQQLVVYHSIDWAVMDSAAVLQPKAVASALGHALLVAVGNAQATSALGEASSLCAVQALVSND